MDEHNNQNNGTCTTSELILYKLQKLEEEFQKHKQDEEAHRSEVQTAEQLNTAYRERLIGVFSFLKFINIVGIISGALLYLSKQV